MGDVFFSGSLLSLGVCACCLSPGAAQAGTRRARTSPRRRCSRAARAAECVPIEVCDRVDAREADADDAEEAAALELVVEAEHPLAAREEVARVLEEQEADEVGVEHRAEQLVELGIGSIQSFVHLCQLGIQMRFLIACSLINVLPSRLR